MWGVRANFGFNQQPESSDCQKISYVLDALTYRLRVADIRLHSVRVSPPTGRFVCNDKETHSHVIWIPVERMGLANLEKTEDDKMVIVKKLWSFMSYKIILLYLVTIFNPVILPIHSFIQ